MAGYVSLQDVTKTYKMGEVTIKAADGISFDVEKGEFVIVVGPSGAGKTTVSEYLRRHGHGDFRKGAGGRRGNQQIPRQEADPVPAGGYWICFSVL